MTEPSPCNANMCLDCERMVFDDSPMIAAVAAQQSLLPLADAAGEPGPGAQAVHTRD